MKVGPLSNDELMERYEDALFALLTDEMASAEGKRLHEENERLKSDPHFALPEGLSARMEEAIRKAYSDPGKKKLVSAMKRMLARAAVFILAFGIITSGLFFTVSAFRARVMNMFHGLNEEFTALTHRDHFLPEDARNPEFDIPDGTLLPRRLPAGYFLYSFEDNDNNTAATYVNEEGHPFTFYEIKTAGAALVDSEDADDVEEIKINGCDGMYIMKDGVASISWGDTAGASIFYIKTEHLDTDTLISIAESVS